MPLPQADVISMIYYLIFCVGKGVYSMIIFVVMLALIIICVLLFFQIKKNINNLKLKKECGKIVPAKVISWKVVPGRPTRYIISVEYEKDKKQEKKTLISSRKFARKYEYIRDVQIVTILNSDKVFLEEEDWKIQNVIYFVLLIFVLVFLVKLLLISIVQIFI